MKGYKEDEGKTRLDLLPFDALEAVAEILTTGAKKYPARNWELGMAYHRPFRAMLKHAWRWWMGTDYDKDSGQHHLAHVATNALFLLTYVLRNVGEDDRPK